MTRFGLWIFMSKITHDFWLWREEALCLYQQYKIFLLFKGEIIAWNHCHQKGRLHSKFQHASLGRIWCIQTGFSFETVCQTIHLLHKTGFKPVRNHNRFFHLFSTNWNWFPKLTKLPRAKRGYKQYPNILYNIIRKVVGVLLAWQIWINQFL